MTYWYPQTTPCLAQATYPGVPGYLEEGHGQYVDEPSNPTQPLLGRIAPSGQYSNFFNEYFTDDTFDPAILNSLINGSHYPMSTEGYYQYESPSSSVSKYDRDVIAQSNYTWTPSHPAGVQYDQAPPLPPPPPGLSPYPETMPFIYPPVPSESLLIPNEHHSLGSSSISPTASSYPMAFDHRSPSPSDSASEYTGDEDGGSSNRYQCHWDQCGQYFNSATIRQHFKDNHPLSTDAETRTCKWDNCGMLKREMKKRPWRHIRAHAGMTFRCSKCNKCITRVDNLTRHERSCRV